MRAARFIATALAGVLTLAGLAGLTGCDGNPEWPPLRLEKAEVTIYLNVPETRVFFMSGSGDYKATALDPTVVDVSLGESLSDSGTPMPYVVIKPKAVGETVVMVSDKQSDGVALLKVTVGKRRIDYRVTRIVTSVDADDPEVAKAIEADMAATARLAEGDGMEEIIHGKIHEGWNDLFGEFVFSNTEGDETISGSMTVTDSFTDSPSSFEALWPSQLHSNIWKLSFTSGDAKWDYYRILVGGEYSRISIGVEPHHYRFYEDLTEYYKAKFPEAGVTGAARMIVASGLFM